MATATTPPGTTPPGPAPAGAALSTASSAATSPAASTPPPTPSSRRRGTRWWANASLLTKGLLVLALPVVALVVAVAASLVLVGQQNSYRSVAINDSNAVNGTNRVLVLVLDAETGIRGYAATGDTTFLQPYATAQKQLPVELTALSRLPAIRGASSAAVVANLKSLTAQELRLLGGVRTATAAGGLSRPALGRRLTGAKVVVDRIRLVIATTQSAETRQITKERATIIGVQRLIQICDVAGLVVGGLGGVLAMYLFIVGIVRRVVLVGTNAERFIQDEPMLPMDPSRDEIGRLTVDIADAAALLAERNVALRHARDDALAGSQAKDTFLSRMSHELRTPLTAVLGFGQLLQMEELEADHAESVDQIVKAGHHLLDLINEVLDIARIETGHLSLSLEPVTVPDLLDEVVALMAPLAAERGIRIEKPATEHLAVLADRQRLKQVVLNLLSNAIKYNRDGGLVTVTSEPAGATTRIAVTDTGAGIPDSMLDRLFVPFDRLDADQSDIVGTGVGLSLSEALVAAMNGSIAVESEVGIGSTFSVTLPACSPAITTDPHAGSVGLPGSGGGDDGDHGVVLYVEDNLANLRVLERVFKHREESLQVAVQGRMCLDLARELKPRVILLDLHLPDMSGEEVLRRLVADPITADIPVVILSADVSQGWVERLLEQGAAAYLPKPIDLRRFVEVLDELAASRPLPVDGSR